MHDFDNNTKLDGLEILKALTHLLPYDEDEDEEKKVDMRGKSVDDIAREKRDRELRYYTGISATHVTHVIIEFYRLHCVSSRSPQQMKIYR